MGTLIFDSSDNIPYAYHRYYRASVTNWRLLFQHNNNLIVVTASLAEVTIENMTIDRFHQLNRDKETIKKSFVLSSIRMICLKCLGLGQVDWITHARGVNHTSLKNEISIGMLSRIYKRDKHIIQPIKLLNHPVVPGFHSIPKIKKGYELCDVCKGSGLKNPYELFGERL